MKPSEQDLLMSLKSRSDGKSGRIRRKRVVRSALSGLTLAILGGFLWYNRVDNTLTDEDLSYIPSYTSNISAASPESPFDEQVQFIRHVQDSVLSIAPVNSGLPRRGEREPKDLYLARTGLCFDRSRVIEKILTKYGFRTRHVFVFSVKNNNALWAFFTPGVPSHAVTEVQTERGWLVVDSNDRWVSLDGSRNPRGMLELQKAMQGDAMIDWAVVPPPIYSDIAPTVFVYGLYSRHGEFYPPYYLFPDLNYGELIENF